MATVKFQVPNWAQAAMAEKIGLDPEGLAVRMEDDTAICYLEHKTRKEYLLDKKTGKVIVT